MAMPAEMMNGAMEVKRTLCKFFEQGQCTKGDGCTWAHGPQELGKVVPAELPTLPMVMPQMQIPQLQLQQMQQMQMAQLQMQQMQQMQMAQAQAQAQEEGVKRTICKFWQEGACKNGLHCTWAHGEQELGHAVIPKFESFMDPAFAGLAMPRLVMPAVQVPSMQSAPRAASGSTEKLGIGTKRTICKFWQQGTCDRGDGCTWAHGEEEFGAPAPLVPHGVDVGMAMRQAAVNPFLGACGWANMMGGDMTLMSPEWALPFGMPTAGFLPAQSFASSASSPAAARGALRPPAVAFQTPFGQAAVRRTMCKFWMQGSCKQDDGQCTWAHGEHEMGTLVGTVGEPAAKKQRLA